MSHSPPKPLSTPPEDLKAAPELIAEIEALIADVNFRGESIAKCEAEIERLQQANSTLSNYSVDLERMRDNLGGELLEVQERIERLEGALRELRLLYAHYPTVTDIVDRAINGDRE